MAKTISDGGGKSTTAIIQIQSNTQYQNYAFTGAGGFAFNGKSVTGVLITKCTWTNATGYGIDGNLWKPGIASSDIEVSYCTVKGFNGFSQYFWAFQQCSAVKIHHNQFSAGSLGTTDNGIIYFENSGGDIYNNYANTVQGKFARIWGLKGTIINIYNNIVVHTSKYSAIELNGLYGGPFTANIYNNTLGDFPATGGTPASGATIYDIDKNGGSSYTFSKNIVFKSSTGTILDNESANGWPTNPDYQTSNKYFPTQAAAGFPTDADLKLPDGTNWNSDVVTPPVNQIPVAKIGSQVAITLPTNSVILDSSGSSDTDGTIATRDWSQANGPTSASLTPTNGGIYCSVTGLVQGTYTFQLIVTDNQGAVSTPAIVVISVLPAPPPSVGPAKSIVTVQTVSDANGNVISKQTYTTSL